jgi:glycosyltransferase involved in cell wall biosynthesis
VSGTQLRARIRHVAVVIPAADEADMIGACLDSVAGARRRLDRASRGSVSSSVHVVLDGCTDDTERIARTFDVSVVLGPGGCVGVARGLGCDAALAAAPGPADQVWLASTDADSWARAEWLTSMVREADLGADLVLGTVRPGLGLSRTAARAWRSAHSYRNDHPHVHGANLGVRGDVYRALGGWAALASGEDVDLVVRAQAAGALIRRPGRPTVSTSARMVGRAPAGFAGYLRDLDAS